MSYYNTLSTPYAAASMPYTARFKKGDRVRTLVTGSAYSSVPKGHEFTVTHVENLYGQEEVYGGGVGQYVRARDCELVTTPKLEQGGRMRLKDGVDEWEVRFVGTTLVDAKRGDSYASFKISDVVPVKGKTPSAYYNNAPGAEPKVGDIFISELEGRVVQVINKDEYKWLHDGSICQLRKGNWQHSIGTRRESAKRKLLVRDGQPYKASV